MYGPCYLAGKLLRWGVGRLLQLESTLTGLNSHIPPPSRVHHWDWMPSQSWLEGTQCYRSLVSALLGLFLRIQSLHLYEDEAQRNCRGTNQSRADGLHVGEWGLGPFWESLKRFKCVAACPGGLCAERESWCPQPWGASASCVASHAPCFCWG